MYHTKKLSHEWSTKYAVSNKSTAVSALRVYCTLKCISVFVHMHTHTHVNSGKKKVLGTDGPLITMICLIFPLT